MSRIVEQQLKQEEDVIYHRYQTIKGAYDTKLDSYNKAVNPMLAFGYNYETVSNWLQYYLAPPHPVWNDLPLRPSIPTYPAQYFGFRIKPQTATTDNHIMRTYQAHMEDGDS